ncbi:MAG TPA: phosphatase PAP2 family protein [Terriglobales bacterium]|nr:phosphatase PAP2 family protein [Terriglobales bacterium]
MTTVDFAILNFIAAHLHSEVPDFVMPFISSLGSGCLVWFAAAAVLLMMRQTRPAGAALLLALVFSLAACDLVIKPLVARPRPFEVNTAMRLLIPPPGGWSFPSGHTSAAFAATAALYKSRRPLLWRAAFVLAVLIAFSRLYLYVHYPTDVLAGALVGLTAGHVGYRSLPCLEAVRRRRNPPFPPANRPD